MDWRSVTMRTNATLFSAFFVFTGWSSAGQLDPASAAPEPDTSSPNLIRQIGADFKNVFTTKDNLLVLGVGLGAAWASSPFDHRIASSSLNVRVAGETNIEEFLDGGQVLGGAIVQVGGAFATYGLGKLLSNSDEADLGRDLVRAQIVTQSLTFAAKLAVSRQRPDASNHKSFPSGHSSGAFATATVLQRHYGWSVGIPAYAMASYVATSRLSEGKHYLSDVVFGAAVGILAARTVTLNLPKARFAVGPMLTPGGYGVQMTLLGSH